VVEAADEGQGDDAAVLGGPTSLET
jgi:hypothetical protein